LQRLTKQHPLAELIFLPCASERLLVRQIVLASVNNGAPHRWQFAHPSTSDLLRAEYFARAQTAATAALCYGPACSGWIVL